MSRGECGWVGLRGGGGGGGVCGGGGALFDNAHFLLYCDIFCCVDYI